MSRIPLDLILRTPGTYSIIRKILGRGSSTDAGPLRRKTSSASEITLRRPSTSSGKSRLC